MPAPERTKLWNRDFTILWLGLVQSYLGDAFLAVGLLWLVLRWTGSAAAASAVLVLGGIPKLLGPLAGVIVDRTSKRVLIVGGDLLRGLILLLLFGLNHFGLLALWHVYTMVVILGLVAIFYDPCLRTILPTLVPDSRLDAANSILQASEQAAMIVGASLAGLTLAAWGAPEALLIDGISFLVAAAALSLVFIPETMRVSRSLGLKALGHDFADGIRYIGRNGEVLVITLVVFACNLILSPVNIVFPVYSTEMLGRGVAGFGFLVSSLSTGFLLGSIAAGTIRLPYARAILIGLTGMGIVLASLSVVTNLTLALVLTALLGMVVPIVQVPLVSRLQRAVLADYRGRVFATMNSIVSLALPVGAALAGRALSALPVPYVLRAAAAGIILVAGTWLAFDLWRRGREEKQENKENTEPLPPTAKEPV